MRAGWRIAINSLKARRGRTALLVAAVAFAAALVVAVTSGIESLNASLRAGMVDMLGRVDLQIRHHTQGRIPESLLELVESWPEAHLVTPSLTTAVFVRNLRNDEERVITGLGIEFVTEWQVHPVELLQGRLPSQPDEAAVDPAVVAMLDIVIGDRLLVRGQYREIEIEVVGIHDRVALAVLQRPEIRLDLKKLQYVTARENRLTSIGIVLAGSADPHRVLEHRRPEIKRPAEIVPSSLIQSGLDRQLKGAVVIQYLAALFTFLCATFIVLTGMTTAVTERVRELAMLRCIGAMRRQLFTAQLTVGALIGCAGGLLGLPLGLLLGWLLYRGYADYLRAGFHTSGLGVTLALGGAVVAGLAGAVFPAFSSARVSPLAALTCRAFPARRRGIVILALCAIICVALEVVLLWVFPSEQTVFWSYLFVGAPLMVVGWFLLGVPAVLGATWVFTAPLSRLLRLPRSLVAGSIRATPYRHGLTAGALMLGLALMIATWAVGRGLLEDWIEPLRFPDAFVHSWYGLDEQDAETIRDLPYVDQVCPIAMFKVPVIGRHLFGIKGITPQRVHFIAFEPDPFFAMTHLDWIQGDQDDAMARLKQGGALLVAREFLEARQIGVGDKLTLGTDDEPHEFEIVGVVSSPGLDIAMMVFGIQRAFHEQALSCVFGTRTDAERLFGNTDIHLIQFNLLGDLSEERIAEQLKEKLGPVRFGSGRRIKKYINSIASDLMSLASVIAFLAMFVASLGMGNVMAANIAARQFEYGVLRTAGAGRSLLARLIFAEVIITLIGASVAGIGLGWQVSLSEAHLYRIMIGLVITPRFPVGPTLIGIGVLLIMSLLASLGPILRLIRLTPSQMLADVPATSSRRHGSLARAVGTAT